MHEKHKAELLALIERIEKDAFDAGGQAMLAALTKAARERAGLPVAQQAALDLDAPSSRTEKPVIERVYSLISSRPGLKGVAITEALKAQDPTTNERTVRTALGRLHKKQKRIRKRSNGGWYPNPASEPHAEGRGEADEHTVRSH